MSKEMLGSGLELVFMRYILIVLQYSHSHKLQESASVLSRFDSRNRILVLCQGFVDVLRLLLHVVWRQDINDTQ